ncbi:alpha/beta fold hydrolase [Streptomyces sp. TRM70308]|uniref:thioesterase II family protein n=1 Tax=Streptomyces sp. TRM70308 TaxID=3131932 RepID=UPI003D06DB67
MEPCPAPPVTPDPASGPDAAPGGPLRLFVFPHAGGSRLTFKEWPARFPARWRVRPVDYPGHGLLAGEPPASDAAVVVDRLLRDLPLGPQEPPFAFFGHSMGSLIAFEFTRRLVAEGRRPPVWLGLSGCGAPRRGGPGEPSGGEPSDSELRRRLAELGGTPAKILDDPELWRVFAPVIRADVALVRRWRPPARPTALPVPLSVFHGEEDTTVPAGPLERWADSSERFLGVRRFPGGHFYFLADPAPLTAHIVADVRAALHRPGERAGVR